MLMFRFIASNFVAAVILLSISCTVFAENNSFVTLHSVKSLYATRLEKSPNIDAHFNEPFWTKLPAASNFVQYEPYNGVAPSQKTEVKIGYTDNALYISAFMYDSAPDSILRSVGSRDNGESDNADLFSISINTFNDDINVVRFMVSAAGVQTDGKYSGSYEDRNWNAVWESKVRIVDNGWCAEIKIPFSALRFSGGESKDWKMNFHRFIKRNKEWDTWSYADITSNNFLAQNGVLKNLQDIKSPVRLSFSPYISGYMNSTSDGKWDKSIAGGMDIKYGITESFTLDMTLIPDFSQVKSDDKVLNLSPFEVKYSENRPFFTEGTELFGRGDIFYSRRIGSAPRLKSTVSDNLMENEIIDINPLETKMINATKVSGRTANGLGIGVLNSMTEAAYAEIVDTLTSERRKFKTQGFTNYNMVVFDQSLPNQSFVSLANTNYTHSYNNYYSDVAALVFQVKDKSLKYRLHGTANVSMISDDDFEVGQRYRLEAGKVKGNFIYSYVCKVEDDKYNPNDMGYASRNNMIANWASFTYKKYEPFGPFRSLNSNISFYYENLYNPNAFTNFHTSFSLNTTLNKSYLSMGINGWANILNSRDYYEPRVWGKFYVEPKMYSLSGWISSDYRKTLAIDINGRFEQADEYGTEKFEYGISPRLRASDKLLFVHNFNYSLAHNNIGFVESTEVADDSYSVDFGKRNITTITNTFNANYTFNEKMYLALRVRYYWRKAIYSDYYNLKDDGYLSASLGYQAYENQKDINYNAFNMDLTYAWYFAPGSQIMLSWKNAITNDENPNVNGWLTNLENTLDAQQYNNISVKILYYLDYQNLKKFRI